MDNGVSGYIGEKYAMIELLRNNFEAYFPTSVTQSGWDILVAKNTKIIKIQVKAVDFKNKSNPTIVGKFDKSNFDFLVIILINFNDDKPYIALVIPKEKLINRDSNTALYKIDNSNRQYRTGKYNRKGESLLIDERYNILYYASPDREDDNFNINIMDYEIDEVRSIVDNEYLNKWNLIK